MQETICFEHKIFSSFKDAHFRRSEQDGAAILVVDMGGTEVSLTLAGIQKEFNIADAEADGQMLRVITEALDFVKVLRPGDPLPKEILTGEPSWEISARHIEIATQRLNIQLVTWLSGGETLITDPEALLQIAEDPNTRNRVSQAFSEAAQTLGFGENGREQVVRLIETLAHELAHIEALRDMFAAVVELEDKIQTIRRLYTRERSVFDVADRIARLMNLATKHFGDTFDQTDANTGEIISILKNIDRQVSYIRKVRDSLYRQLHAWTDVIDRWRRQPAQQSPQVPDLLRDLYRFLAPRYMPVDEWKLFTQLQTDQNATKSAVTW